MTQVNGTSAASGTPTRHTDHDAPQVTTPLRPIDFNGHTPAPPYDDAAVDRALGAWGDQYDQPSAWAAFGDGTDGTPAA